MRSVLAAWLAVASLAAQAPALSAAWVGLAPPLADTTGGVLDVISTPGLERITRFLAFFVSAADQAPRERITP